MYNAFCYGAQPHAGIAPGVDRMVMLIAGEDSIREIIPFPMNKNAQDVLMGAPAEVDEKQLREVHIKISAPEKTIECTLCEHSIVMNKNVRNTFRSKVFRTFCCFGQ